MDIVIIGSGNTAAVLGRKFRAAGHTILQVYSRNASAASELAYEWDIESANYKSLISQQADVYIIAVSDNAITEVADGLYLPEKVVAHTAASVPKDVLKQVTAHYGVFYPLQSLRKEMTELPDVPVFVDGSDAVAKEKLEALARSISPEKVTEGNDDDRLKLHVAAVVVNNFVNHLYALTEDYCKKEGLDFKQLLPIIEETSHKLLDLSPAEAQTGPAIRHDSETIQKHLALLENHPALKNVYRVLSASIEKMK